MKPPLSMEGTTATHCAEPITSSGMPRSGADMISSTTSAAARTRSTALLWSAPWAAAVALGEGAAVGAGVAWAAGACAWFVEFCAKTNVALQITNAARNVFILYDLHQTGTGTQ